MNMNEIRVKAESLGLKTVGIKKPELIKSIQRAEGNFDCFGTAVDYCDQWECCFRSLCLNQGKR
jgi:hypothetical protein